MADFNLIKTLSEAFGPCGLEDEVTGMIYNKISATCDEYGYSPLGGVWGKIKGIDKNAPTRLVATGIDEVSFMVGEIDDNGYVRPKRLTKYNAGAVCAKKVWVGNENVKLEGIMSAKVLHLASGGERENPNVEKCFVNLGFTKKDNLEGKIEKGDFITFRENTENFGKNKVLGKALSCRTGAALMVECAENLKSAKGDTVFFFAVKEKVGMSDLFWAIMNFKPQTTLVLSALPAINSEEKSNCKLDNGIVLPTHDSFSLYFGNETYNAIMKSDIKHQIPKNIDEGQPSAKAQYTGEGCEMVNLSLPVRNLFTPGEIVSLSDVTEMEKAIDYFVKRKI